MENEVLVRAAAYLAAGLCMGIGSFGPALGQGIAAGKMCEGIAKNIEASDKISKSGMLAIVIIETSSLYAFIIAIALVWK